MYFNKKHEDMCNDLITIFKEALETIDHVDDIHDVGHDWITDVTSYLSNEFHEIISEKIEESIDKNPKQVPWQDSLRRDYWGSIL